jgi:uncharacterized protein YijF (DUF1287 family)
VLTVRAKTILGLVLLISVSTDAFPDGSFSERLVNAALERTNRSVRYDGSYLQLGYPGGDVPEDIGVCTDVVIRSYRAVGIDLQVRVHEDMKADFSSYPSQRIWGLSAPDSSIDHRRVPNLQNFFERNGEVLPVSDEKTDYLAGDIVTWMLPGNLPHIGIVTDRINHESGNRMVVHNIGAGPELEDALFAYEITGHYRYEPES